MKMTRYEQETIICYNEEETTASVYTYNNRLAAKLKRLSEKYPDKVRPEREERRGAVSFVVPKSCISVREPYSDERRVAASIVAKMANNRPPNRSIRSKFE